MTLHVISLNCCLNPKEGNRKSKEGYKREREREEGKEERKEASQAALYSLAQSFLTLPPGHTLPLPLRLTLNSTTDGHFPSCSILTQISVLWSMHLPCLECALHSTTLPLPYPPCSDHPHCSGHSSTSK